MSIRTRPLVLIVLGAIWLAVAVYLMVGDVIVRETRLAAIAQFLDRLPPKIAHPMFLLLWVIVLLGWTVPLIVGFRLLFRPDRSD